MESVKLIECPRDAWQGLEKNIPTEVKADYLAKLLRAGFRHLDAVSFVSPKLVPQMADSEQVMALLANALQATTNGAMPEVIGIIVNEEGLERALSVPQVTTLGYPYSISANFRRQNANMSLQESRELVQKAQRETQKAGRDLVVYISMAFGNPFGEPWGFEIVEDALNWLKSLGVKTVSLADTVGVSTAKETGELFRHLKPFAKDMELGAHLHGRAEEAAEKVLAAYEAGCRRFDSALTGLGGCPFAGDKLVGNVPTEIVVSTLAEHGAQVGIEPWAMLSALDATKEIRKHYAE
ncbi:MAG: hydroxymethylglutaryl-CoA lyase [Acidobacteria bacterium]|nr:MAG: hydroxymethylglutaryl-CoA lyase [Acidobacteriota bacterium]